MSIEKEIIWAFMYNDSVCESAYHTVSLHRTNEGAQKALDIHKAFAYKEWLRLYPTKEQQEQMPFAYDEGWRIQSFELKD
jgi:hypothetical protein